MGILAELVQENGGLLRARTATDPARLGAEVQALEALQMQTGAPAVDQDTPGLGRKLIDLISRPNYMAAGIFEEIMEGTPEESLGRAFRELFSGVGGIQGDKEAFAESSSSRAWASSAVFMCPSSATTSGSSRAAVRSGWGWTSSSIR